MAQQTKTERSEAGKKAAVDEASATRRATPESDARQAVKSAASAGGKAAKAAGRALKSAGTPASGRSKK